MTETAEFIGRVSAIDKVALTARVTAFLEDRLFTEGAEVAADDVLFKLERVQYAADVNRYQALVAEMEARLHNAGLHLQRAQQLIGTPAGQRSALDDAIADQRAAAALLASAKAQLRLAENNLSYTEIRAPVGGKISRASVTPGNVVGPSSGTLATIVSQDPMYVVFPVATRAVIDLEKRYTSKGGLRAVNVRLKLPDGSAYDQVGTVDYVDPSVSATTDSILVRAKFANPPTRPAVKGEQVERPLIDGSLVSVTVESAQPVMALSIPRTAILTDQQGNYVLVVGPENKVEQRRVQLGQSTPSVAVIASGLNQGDTVVVDGVQRARPGAVVAPAPIDQKAGAG